MGKFVIDNGAELDVEAKKDHPVEFEKLDNDEISPKHQ